MGFQLSVSLGNPVSLRFVQKNRSIPKKEGCFMSFLAFLLPGFVHLLN